MEYEVKCTQWSEDYIRELLDILQTNENIRITVSIDNEEKGTAYQEEKIIGQYLNQLGIPVHLQGYSYLKYGIMRCINCPEELDSVTKILYPNIAKKYQTTAGKVEHGIRHAIAKAWEGNEEAAWNSIFGMSRGNNHTRPTNSRFLATVADYIKIHH